MTSLLPHPQFAQKSLQSQVIPALLVGTSFRTLKTILIDEDIKNPNSINVRVSVSMVANFDPDDFVEFKDAPDRKRRSK